MQLENNDEDHILNTYKIAINFNANELVDRSADLLHLEISPNGMLNLYPGYTVVSKEFINDEELMLDLKESAEAADNYQQCKCCRAIFKPSQAIKHGFTTITIKDSPQGAYKVSCNIKQQRFKCPHCNKITYQNPKFKHPCHKLTLRLYGLVIKELNAMTSLSDISKRLGVDLNILSAIDKARLACNFKAPSLKDVRMLAIDEHSVLRGHNYVTVVFDAITRKLLYICKGHKKADLMPFFEKLKEEGVADKIEAISCDCAHGFISLVEEYLPNAKIVIDEFHVVRMFGDTCEIIRREERKKLQILVDLVEKSLNASDLDPDSREELLSSEISKLIRLGVTQQYIDELLESADHNTIENLKAQADSIVRMRWAISLGMKAVEKKKPQEVIEAIKTNETLKTLCFMGDKLRDFWHSGYSPAKTKRYIEEWIEEAQLLDLKPLNSFSKFLARHIEHIMYATSTGLSNSMVEGMNSAAKVYQRIIRGVKDVEYYMLKLHSLFSKERPRIIKPSYVRKNGIQFSSLR